MSDVIRSNRLSIENTCSQYFLLFFQEYQLDGLLKVQHNVLLLSSLILTVFDLTGNK